MPALRADEAFYPKMLGYLIRHVLSCEAVRLEARNASQAWIREGLKAGDEVIVYPPPGVSEGGADTPLHAAAAALSIARWSQLIK